MHSYKTHNKTHSLMEDISQNTITGGYAREYPNVPGNGMLIYDFSIKYVILCFCLALFLYLIALVSPVGKALEFESQGFKSLL